jgi:hypothetical protein
MLSAGEERFRKTFQLIVNAVFGESMENVIKPRKVDLVGDPTKLKKLLAKQQLEQFVIVNEDLVLIERIRSKVTLNEPIYIGFTVLDLSKTLIFDSHYNVMLRRYGTDARLLFSNTESLCYHVFTDNMLEYRQLLDTSAYPAIIPCTPART